MSERLRIDRLRATWRGVLQGCAAATVSTMLCIAPALAEVSVLVTAETQGRIGPCIGCPDGEGLGGLARRASAVAEHGAQHDAVLLLDAGDALFGSDAGPGVAPLIAGAYAEIGYQVLHLTHRDLRFGPHITLDALTTGGITAVSANLLDRATGKPIVAPYSLHTFDVLTIGVIGISEPPRAADFLPHLREQLADIEIAPPEDALAEQLPGLAAQADRIVVLYAGSAVTLGRIVERFGDQLDLIATSGLRPDQWPDADGTPLIVMPRAWGQALSHVELPSEGPARALDPLVLGPRYPDDPSVALLLAPASSPAIELTAVAGTARRLDTALPDELETGRLYRLDGIFVNRGARVNLMSAGVFEQFGELQADPGRRLAVLRMKWENIIPLMLQQRQALATEYRFGDLGDHLYLLVNGDTLARIHPDARSLPGHLPTRPLRLEYIGSSRQGNVVFDIPTERVDTLELRLYDFAHGHAEVPLVAPVRDPRPDAEPLSPLTANEIVEAAIYGLQIGTELDERAPPPGTTFAAIDFRARSLFTYPADATAFDPHAEPDTTITIGTVADWGEAYDYMHLVVDGRYAFRPLYAPDGELPFSTLPREPRFLPDRMTGGRALFRIPEHFESLELRGDFPNAAMPDGSVIRPRYLHFPLRGERPETQHESIWEVEDDTVHVAIVGQQVAREFAGAEADLDRRFLIIDVVVRGIGERPELFQTPQQLRYTDRNGRQHGLHVATFDGPYPPAERVWVPHGESRAFQIAYLIDAEERQPRVAYRGFTLAEVGMLKALDD